MDAYKTPQANKGPIYQSSPSNEKQSIFSSNYKVPSSRGGFLSAEPVCFCLKYKPPTIAIVYEIIRPQSPSKVTILHEGSPASTMAESLLKVPT
jgi:hypothetical protein